MIKGNPEFRRGEREAANRSVRGLKKNKSQRQNSHIRGIQTEGQGQWSSPKTELMQTRQLRPQPELSHNRSHSGILECVHWRFRQVSYLWKISCSLVSRHCGNQTTTPPTHKHPIPNLSFHPGLSSAPFPFALDCQTGGKEVKWREVLQYKQWTCAHSDIQCRHALE